MTGPCGEHRAEELATFWCDLPKGHAGQHRFLKGADLADLAESVMERCDGQWVMTRKEISAALRSFARRADAMGES